MLQSIQMSISGKITLMATFRYRQGIQGIWKVILRTENIFQGY